MSQALDECCGIKSLDALFHLEDRSGSENRICGFIPVAPIVKQPRLEQMLKQYGSKENGDHIRTRLALFSNQWCSDAHTLSTDFGSLVHCDSLDQVPDTLQVIGVYGEQRCP